MKVGDTCVIADGKVPTVGHLGGLERDLPVTVPRDARRLELSVCYHTYHPLSHAFLLLFVPSPSRSYRRTSL